jgi:SAM-dependent methyltransferase
VHYRLRREREAIAAWLDEVPAEGQVLDVGCGAGAWSAFFAQRFGAVVAIDQSRAMCQAASRTLAGRRGVTVRCADVRAELGEGPFDLAFLGGVCMYLDDADVLRLLTTLRGRLAANGFAVLRESTVPAGTRRAEGRYQAIYRSVARYRELFSAAGYDTVSVKRNAAYTAMSVAADLVVARRRLFSLPAAGSRAAAALTWWGLRAVAPASFVALPWLLERMGIAWPPLQNHFFRIAVSP